ncbi:MAG: hypothetical protein JWM82_379 [Myxococcales bacterium]|nr:hypothetical protein [Myxococcales bacterium]
MFHDLRSRLRLQIVACLVPLTLTAVSCGGVGTSRETARDQATTVTCDRINACGKIGPGGTYTSADMCQIMQKSFWEGAWPAAECDGKIDGANLDVCLSSISATDCAGGLDVLLTLGKCGKVKVCGATADGGT